MELDMTKGSPFKLIVKFIVPVILGNIFQQFYNMVDTIIVGRSVGLDALAAVGATGTISFLILGFAMGVTTGFTVITAQKYGAGDYDGVKVSVVNALFLSLIVTVLLTVISVVGMPGLLRLMNTPDDIFEMSYQYIVTICYGMGFTILYNIMASFLRAVGNSKVPLYFLIISAFLNIALDLILIRSFGMGVRGAALATIISQGVSGVLCVLYTIKHVDVIVPKKEHWVLDSQCIHNQLSVGIPMALQYSITAIGTIMVQAALNRFGSVIVGSYTAANKACQLATLPYGAMGVTIATYAAQNRGINDIDRIKKGVRVASHMSSIYSIVIYGVAMLTLSPIMKLFIDAGNTAVPFEEILSYGRTYMLVSGTCFIPLGQIFLFRNAMQSCGFSFMAMAGGIVELISRAIIASIASAKMSFLGVCAADPLTWLVTGIYFWIAYAFTLKKMYRDKAAYAAKQG